VPTDGQEELAVIAPQREPAAYSYFSAPDAAAPQGPVSSEVADTVEAPASTGSADTEARPPREKRSRDRYGRDRRERSAPRAEENDSAEPAAAVPPASEAVPPQVTAQPHAQRVMPKVSAYELPVQALVETAQSAGLTWVESDPVKVAQVQALIAATTRPVHVPRERQPLVINDEGPLVLVETRKDLSTMVLPFDTAQPQ
jgi:ribonuclease E